MANTVVLKVTGDDRTFVVDLETLTVQVADADIVATDGEATVEGIECAVALDVRAEGASHALFANSHALFANSHALFANSHALFANSHALFAAR